MTRFPRAIRLRRGATDPDEGGFVLLESIIAMSLIMVIMSALGVFFLNTVASASHQRNRTVAIQIANTTVENIRSRDGASLIVGRDSTSVNSQFSLATSSVQPWLTAAAMVRASDPDPALIAGTSGASAAISTSPTTPLVNGNITAKVNQYLGYCYLASTGTNTDCTGTFDATAVKFLRAVVAVSWTGAHCDVTVNCTYVTSTLISTAADPTFQVNQPLPAAPVAVSPGDQTNAQNDTVSVQLAVQNNTGVPLFTWSATGLPPGLTMSGTGLVSNTTPGADIPLTATPASVTVKVTDAFLRSDTATFNWTIEPKLVINPVSPQASTTTTVVSLQLAATGGDGAPYTWTATGLPTGLVISSAGKITGTASVVGQYPVVVTVADKSTTRKTTLTFTWTVTLPPIAASNPGNQTSTVSTAILGLQLSATGGSGNYVWSDAAATLPAGLSVSGGGLITGTPTALVTSKGVTLTVSDTSPGVLAQTVTFTWTVLARPTVTAPATQTNSATTTANVALATSCPNSPCLYVFTAGQPPGLSVSSAGVITGTLTTAGTYAVTVRVTDAAGASASTAAFTWNVKAVPTLTGLTTNTATETTTESMALAYTCPNVSCTITLAGTIPGLGLSTTAGNVTNNITTSLVVAAPSGTVYIAGTTQTTAVTAGTSKAYGLSLNITDSAGASPAAATATWTAYTPPTQTGLINGAAFVASRGSAVIQLITFTCPVSTCTVTMTGAPLVVGVDADTTGTPTASLAESTTTGSFYARGTISNTAPLGTYTITLKIADSNTASASVTVTLQVTP